MIDDVEGREECRSSEFELFVVVVVVVFVDVVVDDDVIG